MYKILIKKSAEKALNKLPSNIQKQIVGVIEEMSVLGTATPHSKKLQPPIGGYRTRVGNYRILFDSDKEIIVIHSISKRADAYKN